MQTDQDRLPFNNNSQRPERYGFEQLTYEIPDSLVEVDTLVYAAGYSKDMVEKLHSGGLRRVPVNDDKPLTELVNRAIAKLMTGGTDISIRTHGILFTHSVPLLCPADVSFLSMCLESFHLENVPQVVVSGQPCAILHMGVQLASHWLKEAPSDCGILLIGADKAYSAEERIFFGSAMGDVAVAGFITRETARNRILASISQCEIIACEGQLSSEQDIARFRKQNPFYIREAIYACLKEGGVTLQDIAYIVPHTPYMMIWDTMAELLRFPREQILTDYLGETGHLNSNDSFVHYIRAVREGRIKDGDLALLVNPAFGGTRGCTLICR